MKRIFTFLSVCACVLTLNAQSVVIANFDDVIPADLSTWGGVTLDYAMAPDDSPASGQIGVIGVPKSNPSDGGFYVQTNETIDPRNYVGISFLAQGQVTVSFILKLEQTSSDDAGTTRIQDWNTWPKYDGNGEWQEVHIPFTVALRALQEELDKNPNFPATNYDKIVLVPGPYENLPEFTINIDDIKLRTSWDDDLGILLTKSVDDISIIAVNNTISVKAKNGQPASLKVYSISGQEIASGLNQVQIGTKGVYVVKATAGNVSSVSKIVIH